MVLFQIAGFTPLLVSRGLFVGIHRRDSQKVTPTPDAETRIGATVVPNIRVRDGLPLLSHSDRRYLGTQANRQRSADKKLPVFPGRQRERWAHAQTVW